MPPLFACCLLFLSRRAPGKPSVLTSLVLFVVISLVAMLLYSPTLRRQIALLEAGRGKTEEYAALSKKAGMLGGLMGALVVVIVFLMVTKPTL